MRSSPFTIVDCSYVLQHHCLWQYRIMLFSKAQSLYKRFDGAVAPKDRNKKMKKEYVRCALKKDVLGMWVGENESAKYWATVLNGLKNEAWRTFSLPARIT